MPMAVFLICSMALVVPSDMVMTIFLHENNHITIRPSYMKPTSSKYIITLWPMALILQRIAYIRRILSHKLVK